MKRKGRPKSAGRSRPLRGETLVRAAKTLLARWSVLSPDTHPINIMRLSKALGVTRQSLYDNGLKEIVDEHRSLQRSNSSRQNEKAIIRRPLEERIKALSQEVKELYRKIDGWIERWAAVEYNARMLGIDPDLIFAPISPPDRASSGAGRGSKHDGEDDE